jgi:hypothetical protein
MFPLTEGSFGTSKRDVLYFRVSSDPSITGVGTVSASFVSVKDADLTRTVDQYGYNVASRRHVCIGR